MTMFYLTTSPAPVLPGTDAVHQEIELLRSTFGGEVLDLYPLNRPSAWYPKCLYGTHIRRELSARSSQHAAAQVFFPLLYAFPSLRSLSRPLIFTVTGGVKACTQASAARAAGSAHTVVVSNERDAEQLKSWGIENYRVIYPGVDVQRFSGVEDRRPAEFTILVGSAPWTRSQFRSKGMYALLEAVREVGDVRLLFLWRGLLRGELEKALHRYGVDDRAEVIDERADVVDVLGRVHAAVALAESDRVVKAHPQSLLEALAAGRPVMVSESLALADVVEDRGCGAVSRSLSVPDLVGTIERLRSDYDTCASAAISTCEKTFSRTAFLDNYRKLYDDIAAGSR